MSEKFNLNESLVMQEKKEKHDMGREEAQYYHIFLKSLKEKILKRISSLKEKPKEDWEKYPLSMYLFKDETIDSLIGEAKKEAEIAPVKPNGEFVDVDEIRKMSPPKLIEYLDKLDSSLIK